MKEPKNTTPKEITELQLRDNLGEILDQAANQQQRFLVKRSGSPAAIILSLSDFEDLQDLFDTWEEQQDSGFQNSLLEVRQEIETGEISTLDDLHRDLAAKEQEADMQSKITQR